MPPHPHDSFFKSTFEPTDGTGNLFASLLPVAVQRYARLAELEIQPGEFRDPDMQQSHSDLLFSTRTQDGREALLYLLFEHQSTRDPMMPFRLLRYVVRIWERWLRDHPDAKSLPVVIPIVLYHGETSWGAEPDLASILDASPGFLEATRPFIPHFRFLLEDISQAAPEELAARSLDATIRLALLALSSSRSRERLQRAVPFMAAVAATVGRTEREREQLRQTYLYLFRAAPKDIAKEEMQNILLQISGPEGAEDIMNAGEQLVEEGRVQGIAQGQAAGRAEGHAQGQAEGLAQGQAEGLAQGQAEGLAQGQAQGLRLAIASVLAARSISLGEAERARIAACADATVLTEWLQRAATATTEAEVFAAPCDSV